MLCGCVGLQSIQEVNGHTCWWGLIKVDFKFVCLKFVNANQLFIDDGGERDWEEEEKSIKETTSWVLYLLYLLFMYVVSINYCICSVGYKNYI